MMIITGLIERIMFRRYDSGKCLNLFCFRDVERSGIIEFQCERCKRKNMK